MYSLFKSYCCSFYGSCSWDLNSATTNKIYIQWNKAVRNIWHVPYTTHKCLLPHILHDLSVKDQMLIRFVKYYASLLKCDNYVVKYFCMRSAYYADSTLGINCACIWKLFKLNVYSLNAPLCKYVENSIWSNCLLSCMNDVQTGNFIRELCFLRDNDSFCPVPKQDLKDILEMLCTS